MCFSPLSMSECLAKSAQKIDFGEDDGAEASVQTSEDGEKEDSTLQQSLWPWDSVRTKLK